MIYRQIQQHIEMKNIKYIWWKNDNRHRNDGPAYINEEYKIYAWSIKNKDITNEITKWVKDNEIDWRNMSLVEQIMLKLELEFNNE